MKEFIQKLIKAGNITPAMIEQIAAEAISHPVDGEVSALDTMIALKAAKAAIDAALKDPDFMDAVYTEIDNHDGQPRLGATVKTRNLPGKWDYSIDPDWLEKDKAIKNAKADMKAIEKEIQTAYKTGRPLVTMDGEVIEAHEIAYEPGGQTISVSFKQ